MNETHVPLRYGSEYLYDALLEAEVETLIGIPGTQTLPLDEIVEERNEIQYVMARHETAIPHIAWGYYEAGKSIAATVTVPGPGDTNAMHGLKNAYEDCVPLIHISPHSEPSHRGKGPIHEIEPDTFDNVVKANINVEQPIELNAKVAEGIETALKPPYGPVRLGIPSSYLGMQFRSPRVSISPGDLHYDNRETYRRAADALAQASRPLIYVGGGARRASNSSELIQELAAELNTPIAATFKGKGVVPEDNPRFLGVTGSMLPSGAQRVMSASDVVLALGTDFDGPATANWELPLGDTLIHVNLDTTAVDTSYEADIPIVDDVSNVTNQLLDVLDQQPRPRDTWDGADLASAVQQEYSRTLHDAGFFEDGKPATSPAALTAVRDSIPRDTVVSVDVGGFRLWTMGVFQTYAPEEFICAGSWGGMGVGLPAAIGAKLAQPDKPVVCLTGDGGLMMCIHELHTAVELDLDIVIIVSNNNDYGIISKSIGSDHDANRFTWNPPSFKMIADGFGCRATTVETVSDLEDEVERAINRTEGPELIDVRIDTNERSAVDMAEYESQIDGLGESRT